MSECDLQTSIPKRLRTTMAVETLKKLNFYRQTLTGAMSGSDCVMHVPSCVRTATRLQLRLISQL